MIAETTHTYVQRELTRLIQIMEQHGMQETVRNLLLAKDGLRVEYYTEGGER